jgi:Spy/CpxP family protein refolding chaperone
MKPRSKSWILGALTAVMLLGAGGVVAQGGGLWDDDDVPMSLQQRGGYGPGMGMMGGGGMGYGMMGGGLGPIWTLDLSDEQRGKINKIQDELHKKNWDTQGKIIEEGAKLRDLYAADTPDPKKISAVYERVFALKRQKIEASIDAHNRMRAVLTKEQQEQLKQWRRGRAPMYGPGGMMRNQGPMGPGMRMQVP